MPPLVAAASAIASFGIGTFTIGNIVGGLVISFGLSRLGALLTNTKQTGTNSLTAHAANKIQITRDATLPHKICYGRSRESGPLIYAQTTNNGTVVNAYLHLVIPVAAHQINAFEQIFIDENPVILDSNGFVTNQKYTANGKQLVRIFTHLGTPTQAADAHLVSEVPNWTDQCTLSEHAYIYAQLEYDRNVFPNGMPNISAIIQGKLVYDPRNSTTAYSTNWALCVRDYITDTYHGIGAPSSRVDDTTFIAAANSSDETITHIDGTTSARYTCNGSYDSSQKPIDILKSLVTAGAGMVPYTQGVYKCFAGVYQAPQSITIDETWLAGDISVDTSVTKNQLFNAVKGVYIEPQKGWQSTDFALITNTTYEAQDGGIQVSSDVQLPFIINTEDAQRIAKIGLEKSRLSKVMTVPCNLKALQLTIADNIYVSINLLGFSSKIFTVTAWNFSDKGIQLTLQEEASAAYNWTASNATALGAIPTTNLPDPNFMDPPGNPVVTENLYVTTDGSGVKSQAILTWADSPSAFLQNYIIDYRLHGITSTTNIAANWLKGAARPLDAYDSLSSDLVTLGVSWWYNWWVSAVDEGDYPAIQFIRLVFWDYTVHPSDPKPSDAKTADLASSNPCNTLLGFNEPDNATQANMTVAAALALWPDFEATGMRLGSPAVSAGSSGLPWLAQFMAGSGSYRPKVDFICAHWYQDFSSMSFVDYVGTLWELYHLPIWITEIGSLTGGPDVQAALIPQILNDITNLPYIERVAWFAVRGVPAWPASGLLQSGFNPAFPASGFWPSANWTEANNTTGGSETSISGWGQIQTGAVGGYVDNTLELLADVLSPDGTWTFDLWVTDTNECFPYAVVRGDTPYGNNGFAIEVRVTYNLIRFKKVTGGTPATIKDTTQAIALNDIVHFKVNAAGTTLRYRYWLNNAAEPGTWESTDTSGTFSTQERFYLGLTGGNAAAHRSCKWQIGNMGLDEGGELNAAGTAYASFSNTVTHTNPPAWIPEGTTVSPTKTINDIAPGLYDFRVEAVSWQGVTSAPAITTTEMFGLTAPPANITGFTLNSIHNSAQLQWDQAVDKDVQLGGSIRLRWSSLASSLATWSNAVDLGPALPGITTNAVVPLMAGTYMIKAVDSIGNESKNATLIDSSVANLLALNVVITATQDPGFAGTLTTMLVDAVNKWLTLDNSTGWDNLFPGVKIDSWMGTIDTLTVTAQPTYSGSYVFTDGSAHDYIDQGAVYTSRVTINLQASIYNTNSLWDSLYPGLNIDQWPSLIDGTDLTGTDILFYIQTTNDDPSGTPTWSAYRQFVMGDYTARAFRVKMQINNTVISNNVRVTALSVTVDVPERLERFLAQSIGAGGSTMTYALPFFAQPQIAVNYAATDQDTIKYTHVTSGGKWTGITIQILNSGGVARSPVDIYARGY